MTILVTGGAGFIGSNFIHSWLAQGQEAVINLDKLTYAGNRDNLAQVENNPLHQLIVGDIADSALLSRLLAQHQPRAIVNFAAESHVDRSIAGPHAFIHTNIVGCFHLLEASRAYWMRLDAAAREAFRFLHVSTDEVYGSLAPDAAAFRETHPYQPNSPYSASKAAADHLVRAYFHTYGLPVLTTNCSNNYGPFQFPEKLIPLVIQRAREGQTLPIYGDGKQRRDWLYVGDHCKAVHDILALGRPGETYNIGAGHETSNLELVHTLCELLDEMAPRSDGAPYKNQIRFVQDRPGHDRRYAIDASKLEQELGCKPAETFATGLRKTVQWYLDNSAWLAKHRPS